MLSRESTFKLLNDVRGSYVNLNNLNKTTDQSEDDLLDGTLKPLKPSNVSKLTELKPSKELELESSFIETKNKPKDDSLGRLSKLDTISNFSTLTKRHQRSNSLRQFNSKETKFDDQLNNQTNLLNNTKFYDPLIHKLSSFKSILKFDLKGYVI